jgi:hypothetical protein
MQDLLTLLRLCKKQKIVIWFSRTDLDKVWNDKSNEIYVLYTTINIHAFSGIPAGHCELFDERNILYTYEEGIRLLELRAFL